MRKRLNRVEKSTNTETPVSSGTRDAVESSIEISKGDRSITWEESASRNLTKITRWEDAKNQPARSEQSSP